VSDQWLVDLHVSLGFADKIMGELNRIESCLDYTLKVLLGEGYDSVLLRKYIAYSDAASARENGARLCIVPSGFFAEHYGKAESLPKLPLQEIEGVPLLYGSPRIRREGKQLIIHADIIASAYFLLTRYEEMVRRDVRDKHGRFPGKQSLPYRAGFIDRPIVDEYAALLRKWLREAGVDIPEPNRRFSVLLTHDVDVIHKYHNPLRTAASAALGRRRWHDVRENLAVCLRCAKDPFDTFDEISQLDSSIIDSTNGLRAESVYFFMAGGWSKFSGMYRIQSRLARRLLRRVQSSGATIGLHASYDAGLHSELVTEEKATLESIYDLPIYFNRYHFLSWREIQDGWALARAGITDDSSLGYADVAGFRLGVCRPIPLFDPTQMKPFGIEEHPLIVMDCTLSNNNYMNLQEEEAFEYCCKLIKHTRQHNGEFVTLWHNTTLAEQPGNYHPQLYKRLLKILACEEF